MMRASFAAPLGLALVVAACATSGGSELASATDAAPSTPTETPTDAALDGDADTGEAGDAEAAACPSPCGYAPQCGCSASETCERVDGSLACLSAGTAKAGVACLSTRECAAGLVCSQGVCRPPCATPGDACTGDRAGTCSAYADGDAGAAGPSHNACAVKCAYDREDACGFTPGDLLAAACVYQPATDTVECRKVRNVQLQSGLCDADPDCGAGRVCIPSAGFNTCRRLCKVGSPDACGGCKPFAQPRVVDGVSYGYCP